jgi:membrane associated rhomboid family serine protease
MVDVTDQAPVTTASADVRASLWRYLGYGMAYLIPCAVIGYGLAGMFCARIFMPSKKHGLVEHVGLSGLIWGIVAANLGLIFLCSMIIHLHEGEDRAREQVIRWCAGIVLLESLAMGIYLFLCGFPQDF